MKFSVFVLLLSSLPLQAHVDQAATGFSVFWNSFEIVHHVHGLLCGHTSCCGRGTKAYHAIEIVGHSTNLVEGTWHFMEKNTSPVILSGASFLFNLWATYAQYHTLRQRGFSKAGILLAPVAAVDLWGHSFSTYVAARELTGI